MYSLGVSHCACSVSSLLLMPPVMFHQYRRSMPSRLCSVSFRFLLCLRFAVWVLVAPAVAAPSDPDLATLHCHHSARGFGIDYFVLQQTAGSDGSGSAL